MGAWDKFAENLSDEAAEVWDLLTSGASPDELIDRMSREIHGLREEAELTPEQRQAGEVEFVGRVREIRVKLPAKSSGATSPC